jgi:hypothetical protein
VGSSVVNLLVTLEHLLKSKFFIPSNLKDNIMAKKMAKKRGKKAPAKK